MFYSRSAKSVRVVIKNATNIASRCTVAVIAAETAKHSHSLGCRQLGNYWLSLKNRHVQINA